VSKINGFLFDAPWKDVAIDMKDYILQHQSNQDGIEND